MPRTGRPRKDGKDAVQAFMDQQYARVFNRLNVSELGLLPWRHHWMKRLQKIQHRRRLSCELDGEATEFSFKR